MLKPYEDIIIINHGKCVNYNTQSIESRDAKILNTCKTDANFIIENGEKNDFKQLTTIYTYVHYL
jgi:hypothetical protein